MDVLLVNWSNSDALIMGAPLDRVRHSNLRAPTDVAGLVIELTNSLPTSLGLLDHSTSGWHHPHKAIVETSGHVHETPAVEGAASRGRVSGFAL
ncbi:MAG: hypothetical protein WA988_16665 [Candidatus Nanopelagicales bacterium]